jgi:hypothetical protein
MKSYTAQEALITLYNASRSAPLTLEQHDNNRACVDVLAQVIGIKLEWTVPTDKSDEQPEAEIVSETADETVTSHKKSKKNKR